MTDGKLSEYRARRNPDRTPEPQGGGSGKNLPRFVIQKHDASSLHYDFRLEIDGALKSWAVPKGPSTDPRDKRLAVQTEDHPLDYADFEGVIPEDEYGGGTVLIWDAGHFQQLPGDEGQDSLAQAWKAGHLSVWLQGEKLRGGYALTRMRRSSGQSSGKPQWLLVKMDDDEADARRNPVNTQPESVYSGRSLKQIRRDVAPGS